MEDAFNKLISETLLYAPRASVSLLIFVAFWLGGVIIQKILLRIGNKSYIDQSIFELAGKVIKFGGMLSQMHLPESLSSFIVHFNVMTLLQ